MKRGDRRSCQGIQRSPSIGFKDPEKFTSEVRRLYRQWAANRPEPSDDVAEEEAEAADVTGTFEEAEEFAWIDIERHLRSMAPYDFQNLVAALLRAMGYHVSWIAPPGRGDGGIDILAHTDPLGINMPRIKVQVKRRTDKVAVDGLRTFMAVLGDQDVGLFVSAGGFTREQRTKPEHRKRERLRSLGSSSFSISGWNTMRKSKKRIVSCCR